MRKLNDHQISPADLSLNIAVTDQPGSGGACHRYEVTGFNPRMNASFEPSADGLQILFQNGPVGEAGINGITQEVLLAIVADRLRSFQAGPYANKANACALTHVEEALHWLQQRTIERLRRGVEGTSAA